MKFEDLKTGMILWPENIDIRNNVTIVMKKMLIMLLFIFLKLNTCYFVKREYQVKIGEINQRYIIKDFFEYVGDFL